MKIPSSACISKPLSEDDLPRVVGAYEVRNSAYAETANGVRTGP